MSRFFDPLYWQQLWLFAENNIWLTLSFTIVLGIVGEMLFRVFYRWFGRITDSTTTHLDDLLLKRMRYPMHLVIWLGALLIFLHLQPQFESSRLRLAIDITEIALIIYIVVETLETLLLDYYFQERQRVQVPHVLRDLGRGTIFLIFALVIIQNLFNINLSTFLATSTVITVVLGLALQNTLGNLFAGIAIHLERPFQLGDWVLYKNYEGKVVRLGWRSTVLQNLDGNYVTVPNNTMSLAEVINFYAPSKLHARKVRIIGRHGVAPRDVERAVAQAAEQVPRILKDKPVKVWLVEYTPVAIIYVIKFWIEDFAYHDDVESELMKEIWYAFEELEIELPVAISVVLGNPADETIGGRT